MSMEAIAQIHAVGFCMEADGGRLTELRNKYPMTVTDFVSSEKNHEAMKGFFEEGMRVNVKLLQAALDQYEKDNPILKSLTIPKVVTEALLNKIAGYPMMNIFRKTRTPNCRSSGTFVHGDYHMWNVAFKDDQMKIFDYQIVHYSSFGNDLNHFISQTSTPKQRKTEEKTEINEETNVECPRNLQDTFEESSQKSSRTVPSFQ